MSEHSFQVGDRVAVTNPYPTAYGLHTIKGIPASVVRVTHDHCYVILIDGTSDPDLREFLVLPDEIEAVQS